MKQLRQSTSPVFIMLSGLLLVYLLLPLVGFLPRLSASTLMNWRQADVLAAVAVSVETATAATLLLTVFGIPLSYLLARHDFRGKTFVNLLVQLPLAVPPVVSGILLLMIFGPYAPVGSLFANLGLPLTDSLPAIVTAQAFVASPFLIIASRAAFEAVDPTLEQMAATLGKSPWEILRRVTLPLAWSAIRSAVTLSWVRALGEFGATAMVAYHPYSLPILAWVRFSESGLDSTAPLVMLMLAVGGVGLGLSYLLARPPRSIVIPLSLTANPTAAPAPGSIHPADAGAQGTDFRPVAVHRSRATPISVQIVHHLGDFRLNARFQTTCQRVAVLGPSGAGKTLLLKALAGLLRPAEGRLTVRGRTLFDSPSGIWLRPDERRVGYVPQHFALFSHMTVWKNILFAMDTGARDTGRAAQVVSLLGLESLVHHYPNQLSYGQQQRVALARALVRQPDYLLLDEPLASLDAPLRLHLRRELLRILRQLALPVVLVTHDADEAYELAEEVVVMAEGRVLQHGGREDVFSTPSSAQVATLLGIRNAFCGQVVSSTSLATVIEYKTLSLLAPPGPFPPGTAIDFFIDPARLTLLDSADADGLPTGTVLSAEIDAVWPRPSSTHLVVAVGQGALREYWEIERVHGEESTEQWKEGESVRVFVPQTAVHLMEFEWRSPDSQTTSSNSRVNRGAASRSISRKEDSAWRQTGDRTRH